LSELEPQTYAKCLKNPKAWCLECSKAVYGLKDAPLLWHLRCVATLKELGLTPSPHDSCLWRLISPKGQLQLLMSLHVDDTLVTGEDSCIKHLHALLEKKFGSMTFEEGTFKHFGVHITKHNDHSVELSQEKYLATLKDITVHRTRGDGRVLDSEASESEISDFRSLVSGVAWMGVTHPAAQSAASLYQHCLPQPKISDLMHLNAFVQQLRDCNCSLKFIPGLPLDKCKLIVQSDSSLGNAAKYSQGGHVILLCLDDQSRSADWQFCGKLNLLTARSARSKRVATSTMSAALLQISTAVEESVFVQSWLFELMHPATPSNDLLHVDPHDYIPCDASTDCNDAYEVLIKAAVPTISNRNLILFVSMLREAKQLGYIRSWYWHDTHDMLADVLTKLLPTGLADLDKLTRVLKSNYYEPSLRCRVDGVDHAPSTRQPKL
jgi:hypothetical protein